MPSKTYYLNEYNYAGGGSSFTNGESFIWETTTSGTAENTPKRTTWDCANVSSGNFSPACSGSTITIDIFTGTYSNLSKTTHTTDTNITAVANTFESNSNYLNGCNFTAQNTRSSTPVAIKHPELILINDRLHGAFESGQWTVTLAPRATRRNEGNAGHFGIQLFNVYWGAWDWDNGIVTSTETGVSANPSGSGGLSGTFSPIQTYSDASLSTRYTDDIATTSGWTNLQDNNSTAYTATFYCPKIVMGEQISNLESTTTGTSMLHSTFLGMRVFLIMDASAGSREVVELLWGDDFTMTTPNFRKPIVFST